MYTLWNTCNVIKHLACIRVGTREETELIN